MANTITVIPGAGIGSNLGNLFITVLVVIFFVSVILWLMKQVPGLATITPTFSAPASTERGY